LVQGSVVVPDGDRVGGCLVPDTPGFVARSMARKLAGDWRDPDQVRRWTDEIGPALTTLRTSA